MIRLIIVIISLNCLSGDFVMWMHCVYFEAFLSFWVWI